MEAAIPRPIWHPAFPHGANGLRRTIPVRTINAYAYAVGPPIPTLPVHSVLIDTEVLLLGHNNDKGIVTAAAQNGKLRVWMLSGENIGQEVWTVATDIVPMQPGVECSASQGLVKLLDGPFIGRVGRLQHIVEGAAKALIGVVKFGNGEMKTFDMSLVVVAHAPRACCY